MQGNVAMWLDSSGFAAPLEDPTRSKVAGKVGYGRQAEGKVGRLGRVGGPGWFQKDLAFRVTTGVVGVLLILIVAAIGFELTRQSWLSIQKFGLSFWRTQTWDPVAGQFGALLIRQRGKGYIRLGNQRPAEDLLQQQ